MPRTRKPVSGPGKLSQRTDLAQPVRVPTGGPYGQAQRLAQQQQAAPLPASRGATPAGTPPPAGAAAATNIFGPTRRPGEPVTAGAPLGPGDSGPMSIEGMDVDRILQVMSRLLPNSAAINRLMIKGL